MNAAPITSTELQDRTIELARAFGWRVAHFRPAKTVHGWRTPVSADGKGWPDLVLVHPLRKRATGGGRVWVEQEGGVLFRELKGPRDKLTPEQEQWGEALVAAGADWAVWRPADWEQIVRVLTFNRGSL